MTEGRDLETLSSAATERNVIAALSQSEGAWLQVSDLIGASDFYYPLNRALFLGINSLYGRGGKVDVVLLRDSLPGEQQAELDKLGGWEYLGALKDLPMNPQNAALEARKLKELSLKRRVARAGGSIEGMAFNGVAPEKLIDEAEIALLEAAADQGPDVTMLGSGSLKFAEERASAPAEVPGLMSGFKRLDKHLQGFQPSRLYVVAARLKVGKSTVLLNWATNIAKGGDPVLYISTEHSHDDERSRFLSLVSGVPEHQIRNGTYSLVPDLARRVEEAGVIAEQMPIYFCSMPDFTTQKIRNLARKHVRMNGVKAVFFDYIKAGKGADPNTKEWQYLGAITDTLKELASAEKIPIITAAQLNREAAWALKKEEEFDSETIAGSDRIAQFASVVMILRYPNKSEKEHIRVYGEPRILKITNNRHGSAHYAAVIDFEGTVLRMDETDIAVDG